tara:strand:+ start:948 stop:1196 length:249 start_codon:yes stop_codon:yes gene_type:complete
MNNYTYTIVNITDLDSVDFSEVHETSADTIRKSIDETKFVMEYDETPSFVADGTIIPLETLTHAEALELMTTEDWTCTDELL